MKQPYKDVFDSFYESNKHWINKIVTKNPTDWMRNFPNSPCVILDLCYTNKYDKDYGRAARINIQLNELCNSTLIELPLMSLGVLTQNVRIYPNQGHYIAGHIIRHTYKKLCAVCHSDSDQIIETKVLDLIDLSHFFNHV